MLHPFLASAHGAWVLAAAATLLAAWESAYVPWAPFLILYALALPWPGLIAGTAAFGGPWSAFGSHPALICGLSLGILAWEAGVMGFGYEAWARKRAAGGPARRLWRFSPAAAMEFLLGETARRRGLSLGAVRAWAAGYFLVWAPLAEEIFFWGYLYPIWRPAWGAIGASALTAAWFALRHGTHFLFLPRPYPWPAGLAFMASAGGAAFGNGLLFEACGSLWPLIALHFASNLLSLAWPPPVPKAKRNGLPD